MTILASIGVGILMAAFLANLTGRLESSSVAYQGMNAVGAGIAAFASYGIGFMPFVVLEGTWCVAALLSLFRTLSLARLEQDPRDIPTTGPT